MSRLIRYVFLFALLAFVLPTSAQFNNGSNFWKKYKTELYGTIGGTSFLGELGGRDEIGSDFINDFELSQTRWGVHLGVRRFLNKNIALRGNLMFGYLSGNDNLTEEPFRQKRNLHFRSFVTEISGLLEYCIRTGGVGNRFKLGGSKGSRIAYKEMVYTVFAGVGGLGFNPKGRYQEQWYSLRNLGTEGQNVGNASAKYNLFTLVVPVGFNIRKAITRRINVSFELNHRFTFSDYIDDVSTVYYDNESIANFSGEVAAHFADPSLEFLLIDGEEVVTNNTAAGLQRGDPTDNDSYMTFSLGANYKLNTHKFKRNRQTVNNRRRGGRKLVF